MPTHCENTRDPQDAWQQPQDPQLLQGGKRCEIAATDRCPPRRLVMFLVEADDIIPADGEVIEGIATVDESAITGEVAAGDPRKRRRPQRSHGRYSGLSATGSSFAWKRRAWQVVS